MASLTGTKIKDTYDSLLKVSDNGALDGTLQTITDGLGNNSSLSLSTAGASVTGTLSVSGATTLSGGISGNVAFDTDTLYVNAASNEVGVGTLTPLAKTHVKTGSSGIVGGLSSNYDDFAVEGSGNAGITILSPNSNNCGIAFADSDSNNQGAIIYSHSSDSMAFRVSAAEAMRIDTDGNLGVGTTTVTANLDLAADDIVNGVTLRLKNVHNGSDWALNSKLGVIDFYSTDASAVGVKGSIELIQSSASTSNPSATDLVFNNYSGGSLSERMRITSGGNVLVGVQSITDATSRSYGNAFSGSGSYANWVAWGSGSHTHAQFRNETNVVGSISSSSTATAYNTSSDYRLKEDWQPMEDALDRVDALKPVNFAWKVDGKRVDGFLAHELQEVIPEAVTGEKDAVEEYEVTPAVLDEEGNVIEEAVMGTRPVYQGIDQSKIVPLLVAAIQELRAEIEALKA